MNFQSQNIRILILIITLSGSLFSQPSLAQNQAQSLLSKKQSDFLSWEFGIFLHFNMATFVNREWATGHEDPMVFNPGKLNCNQWAKAAKSAGMKYAVLTVKHTGGWCLWPSAYTTHGMQSFKNYKGGNGDIVRKYVDACRKHNLKVGFYYCMPGDYSTRFGNKEDAARGYKIGKDQKDLHGLPPEAEGDYTGFIEKQITELLTKYGVVDLFWVDQFNNKYTGKDWQKIKSLIHQLQPNCILLANNSNDYNQTDIYSHEYPYWKNMNRMDKALPVENNTNPAEVCDCIVDGSTWFWNTENPVKLQKAQDIADKLRICNQRKANYLLNVQPDRNGRIRGDYLKTLHEIGKICTK